MKLLLVEDNENISKGLLYFFKKNNYNLISKNNINDAKKYIQNNKSIALVILDITLPDGNGFDFYEKSIKKLGIPTIFLTAKDGEEDVIKGLNIGAEDYITKPFSSRELLVRINKILARNNQVKIIKAKDISFDLNKYILKKQNKKILLSPIELKLMTYMFLNINKTVSRNSLIDKIWEWTGNDIDDHTVTVYFNRLRDKLKTDIIKTVKGMGYRIDEE